MTDAKEKMIALNIVKAQLASDGGKHIIDLYKDWEGKKSNTKKCYKLGYDIKDQYILNAIKFIQRSHNSKFRYSIIKAYDQHGYKSYIIYFDYNNDIQISFHSPCEYRINPEYEALIKNSRKTFWKEDQNSRINCIWLAKSFQLH